MISLFALIICLGIVVDDAIVVGEHADFRARRFLEEPVLAAERAAQRMAPPVFSATVTTVIAFAGLTAISGRFGSLIADIPFTVCVVLIASLAECFLILPHHMSKSLRVHTKVRWFDYPSHYVNKGFSWFRDRIFQRGVRWIIRLRYPVIAGALVLLSQVTAMFLSGDVSWRFFNSPERGNITGNVAMLPGATRADTREMVTELQRAVDKVASDFEEKHGTNPVTFSLVQIGGTTGRGLSGEGTKDADLLGSIDIELIDADLRPYSSFAYLGALQDEVRDHPLLETLSFRGWRGGPGGDSLDVSLFGADSEVLKQAAEYLKNELLPFAEVSAVQDDMAYDKSELILELSPLGKSLGFSIDDLGAELYRRLNGITAAEFPVGLRTGTVWVGFADDALEADFVNTTRIRSPSGQYVNLSDIVVVEERLGFSQLIRQNGIRRINVTGDISEDDPVRATEITEQIRDVILPEITAKFGVDFRIGGLAEQERDFLTDATLGFYLCLLGIFLALSWIFGSWTRPIVVMAIIPFGLIGTIWGHYLWDVPLSMLTVVGLIGMTGIIINDSIVLVTTIDQYAKNRALLASVIDATCDRLRPVLLTTLTTVLGLAPLLYETSQQAQFLKPTVITLSYGLGVGLFIVLLIIPSLVLVQQDVGNLFRALRRGLLGRRVGLYHRAILIFAVVASVAIVFATVGLQAIRGEILPPVQLIHELFDIAHTGASWVAMIIGVITVFILSVLAGLLRVRGKSLHGGN